MGLIKCSECGKEISDRAEKCINCGCPINKRQIETKQIVQNIPVISKVIFQTTSDGIALLQKYIIKDENGKVITKLRRNDYFEVKINFNTRFFIKLSGGFASFKEIVAPTGQVTKFLIGTADGGCSCYINKI